VSRGSLLRPGAALLPAGLCGQGGGDGLDGVESSFRDADDEVVGFVVGQCQPAAVEAVERDGRGEREPLVAAGEGQWLRAVECSSAAALASGSG
jgi:hypothetical protein